MGEQLTRSDLTDALVAAFEPLAWADALWEAGSAAFGRDDEWSDLDLSLQVAPGRRDEALEVADRVLATLSPVEIRWRVPEPTWHGHAQCFWRLRDAGEYLLVDLAVMERGAPDRFLQSERHGRPVVRFDKGGWVAPEPLDREALERTLAARVETLRAVFPLFRCLAKKEVVRGRSLEAAGAWHGHVLRPLVNLLRIRHSPERHDFGFRLIHEDLPPGILAELEPLAWPPGPESIEDRLRRAEALFDRTLAELGAERLDR
jgi:hypothetical protein